MEPNTNKKDLFVELESYRQIYCKKNFIQKADEIYESTGDLKQVDDFCKKELKRPVIEKLKRESKINKRFKDCTFENFDVKDKIQDKALKQAKNYVQHIDKAMDNGLNIIICGNSKSGTGKTRLACTITNELLDRCIPAKFICTTSMFDAIKQSFNTSEYATADILTIDDLGKERGTDWVCEQIYAILNSRYETMKPTIITIEGTIDDLLANYGPKGNAIIGRLIEKFILIELDGEDYRRKRS